MDVKQYEKEWSTTVPIKHSQRSILPHAESEGGKSGSFAFKAGLPEYKHDLCKTHL